MRIYIPATSIDLPAQALSARTVHAVTEGLVRVADISDVPASEKQAVLEAMAMNAAADDSLRTLVQLVQDGVREEAPNTCTVNPALRRIVAVAEVPNSMLAPCTDSQQLPTACELVEALDWAEVEAIHVDDSTAESLIAEALTGSDEAFERTYDEELMWFDASERSALTAQLSC